MPAGYRLPCLERSYVVDDRRSLSVCFLLLTGADRALLLPKGLRPGISKLPSARQKFGAQKDRNLYAEKLRPENPCPKGWKVWLHVVIKGVPAPPRFHRGLQNQGQKI